MITLHNTLSGEIEDFVPMNSTEVKMYHCGPTVYGIQHIGNLSMFVFTDILRRTLEANGFGVKQVINFTDFGHLTSDADVGEDKMTKGLRAEGLEPSLENMKILGKKFADIFLGDISDLNVRTKGTLFPFASDYIPAQIEMIKTLEEKGFTYTGKEGVYFDTSKFPDYGKLGNINLAGLEEGARVAIDTEKKNPTDFLLWKSGSIGWESPWGTGFPGWHIECSAMIRSILGDQIDIHTGGIEHIPVHHNNEIAQSESATGKKPFSKYWLHRAHLQIEKSKIAKSAGNVVYLSQIIEHGLSPLALRYFLLGAHYRTPMNFTWEGVQSAQNAYRKLKEIVSSLPNGGTIDQIYTEEFMNTLSNDLNTPEALATLWKLVRDESLDPADKRATILAFDDILGLDLHINEYAMKEIPPEVKKLLQSREEARKNKDFIKSDELRDEIEKHGFIVEDKASGQEVRRA